MPHSLIRRGVIASLIVAVGVALSAQAGRWEQPYTAGRRAVEAKRFDEAVKQLERAIGFDPRQEPNKVYEGVYRTDYFPYYYLGIAYLELGNYAKAQENFDKAGERLPRNLTTSLEQYRQRLAVALKPPAPAADTRFAQLIRDADTAVASRDYRGALTAFDAARTANAGEYTRQNVQPRRDSAARMLGQQVAAEGQQLMGKSLSQARARFEEADRLSPGLKEAADGLATIKAWEEAYATARNGAEQDIAASNWPAAQQKLQQAQKANPERYAADNLGAQMTLVENRLSAPPARGGQAARGGAGGGLTLTPIPTRGNSLAPGGGTSVPATVPPTPPAQQPRPDPARLFEEAVRMSKDGQYADAEAGYAAVVMLDPSHKQAATALETSRRFGTLVGEGRAARDRGDNATARGRFEEAQRLDALRFNREGLAVVLKALAAPVSTDPLREPLRQGLQALLRGDARGSAAILEPAISTNRTANGASAAALYAYLGVAYATQAFSLPSGDEQARLRAGALDQFRQALVADRTYQLSPRLVSPKILAVFEEAKR